MSSLVKDSAAALHARLKLHLDVAGATSVDQAAVTRTGYVVRRLTDGLWRLDTGGVRHIGGFDAGVTASTDEILDKLGGLVRRGDVAPDCGVGHLVEAADATEAQFLAGQAVSFMALDGTKAVARYTRLKDMPCVGSLEVWGRKHHPGVVYSDDRARQYFDVLTAVFAH